MLAGCERLLPGRAVVEVVVVEVLSLADAFQRGLAGGDALQLAEVLEPLHAGGEDDQQVGVAAGGGGEGVHGAGRDDDQVALTRGEDTFAGEHLGGSGDDVEQLAGAGVMVGCCSGHSVLEGDPLAAECAAGGAAVGVEPAGDRRGADNFCLGVAHEDQVMRWHWRGHGTQPFR